MVVDRPVLVSMLVRDFLLLSRSFDLLTVCILNDQILRLDLIRRAVDHVLDDKLSVAQFADAASLCIITACCLFCSEKPCLFQAVFATGLSAERTM